MNILIVEDEPQLGRDIQHYLSQSGDHTELIERGDWAVRYLLEEPTRFDMVVLDLGLPGLPGLDVLKRWRTERVQTPVLILTARNSWQERVDGLNAGADDYLGKPFQPQELMARMEAIRRRVQQQGQLALEANGLTLKDGSSQVQLPDGQMQDLTSIELSMLRLLMQQAGKIVSKQQLLDACYDWQEEKNPNLVEVYIRRLRKKVGVERIQTYRGQGYMMVTS